MVTLRRKTSNPLIKSTLGPRHEPYGPLSKPIVVRPRKGSKHRISKEWMHICCIEETGGAYIVWDVKSWRSACIGAEPDGLGGALWSDVKAVSMAQSDGL